jgi:peptidoglycan/xylan/chitin deacetylase (PgdA/CDA1 family)
MNRRTITGLIPRQTRQRLYEVMGGRREDRWRRFPGIEAVPSRGQAVLTFDDGPDPECTPEVLAALRAAGARATFFVLGEQMARHGGLVEAIVSDGHEVGVHGYTHLRHDKASEARSLEDIQAGARAVAAVAGTPQWFRPPFGRPSRGAAEAAAANGLSIVYWSAWGLDWETRTSHEIACTAAEQLADGGILLLHDTARYNRRSSAAPTAAAIPDIIDNMRARGIEPVTLGTALSK